MVCMAEDKIKKFSLPGSRTQLSRVSEDLNDHMTGACTNRYTSKDMRGESVSPPCNTAISPMRLEQDMVYLVCVYIFEACSRL